MILQWCVKSYDSRGVAVNSIRQYQLLDIVVRMFVPALASSSASVLSPEGCVSRRNFQLKLGASALRDKFQEAVLHVETRKYACKSRDTSSLLKHFSQGWFD